MIQLNVEEILKRKRLSKYWLYNQMGLSYKNLDNMINNQTKAIRFENIEKLCRILECTPNDLFKITPDAQEGEGEERDGC